MYIVASCLILYYLECFRHSQLEYYSSPLLILRNNPPLLLLFFSHIHLKSFHFMNKVPFFHRWQMSMYMWKIFQISTKIYHLPLILAHKIPYYQFSIPTQWKIDIYLKDFISVKKRGWILVHAKGHPWVVHWHSISYHIFVL